MFTHNVQYEFAMSFVFFFRHTPLASTSLYVALQLAIEVAAQYNAIRLFDRLQELS